MLRLACVGVREIFDHVLRSLPVPFLRDNDVSFAIVFSSSGVDASDLLDEERLRRRFPRVGPTPRTLSQFKGEDANNTEKRKMERTHPGRVVLTSFGASWRISRCLASWKSYR